MSLGQIIVLNGAPRSGKSSIVSAIQDTFDGVWMNLGVDTFKECALPERYSPGIGLRPGSERPDLEPLIQKMYAAMYEAIADHSRLGLNVAVDVGHHDCYSAPLNILPDCARRLRGLPAWFVGVRCPVETIMQRRIASQSGGKADYEIGTVDIPIPAPVALWHTEVHKPGLYDLEVDTSKFSPEQCAEIIRRHLTNGPAPTAFDELATL